MFTTIAYSQSINSGGVLTKINGLADPHVRVSGADIIVPPLTNLWAAFHAAVSASRAQLQSPSLRRVVNQELDPLNIAATPGSPLIFPFQWDNPVVLDKDEALDALVAGTEGVAEQKTVVVLLADGKIVPVALPSYSVRVTASATLTANAWTNAALTFDQALPRGHYQLVGAMFQSAGLVAYRFVFPGYAWRPGFIGQTTFGRDTLFFSRYGRMGVWGEFEHNTPPTVDFLSSSADTSETGVLDVIKTG